MTQPRVRDIVFGWELCQLQAAVATCAADEGGGGSAGRAGGMLLCVAGDLDLRQTLPAHGVIPALVHQRGHLGNIGLLNQQAHLCASTALWAGTDERGDLPFETGRKQVANQYGGIFYRDGEGLALEEALSVFSKHGETLVDSGRLVTPRLDFRAVVRYSTS